MQAKAWAPSSFVNLLISLLLSHVFLAGFAVNASESLGFWKSLTAVVLSGAPLVQLAQHLDNGREVEGPRASVLYHAISGNSLPESISGFH
jgi:hypothetical protein